MFKGSKKYWALAIICGLMASFLSYRYLQEIKTRYSPDDLVPVVTAKTTITKDSCINADQLKVENLPSKFVHPAALHDIKEVVGKTATVQVVAGEEILGQKLLSASEKAKSLSYAIPESKRAVSVPVNNISGVSGFIKVGDRVDVIATLDIPVVNSQSISFCVLTLQDIQVLALGENPEFVDKKNQTAKNTITLAVSMQEAQPLILASERGNIRLLLRSPLDKSRVNLPPYQLQDFLAAPGI